MSTSSNPKFVCKLPFLSITFESEANIFQHFGVLGLGLSILAIVICLIPILNWIALLSGGLFSLLGLWKSPRKFGILGLLLTLINAFVQIAVVYFIAQHILQ